MNKQELPLPSHYHPDAVGEVWRVPYEARAAEARNWAQAHQISHARADKPQICFLGIDIQNTFCIPEFELFVGGRSGSGAVDDNRRLCEFLYKNLDVISQVDLTLDTHSPLQIVHAAFLVDQDGNHPAPMTQITAQDIESGRWQLNPAIPHALGLEDSMIAQYLAHYTKALQAKGKYDLTIWPYHAMLGGIGHALVSAVEEAVFFHSIARFSQPEFHIKGNHPLTENYSAIGPEVDRSQSGQPLGERNNRILDKVRQYDAIVIAGQAMSHCVAWTVSDLLTDIQATDPLLAGKIYLLEDCTSPVVVPGIVDYTEQAEAAYARFAEAGMHLVRSTVQMAEWPGLAQRM